MIPAKSFHAWLKTLFINRFRSLQRNRGRRFTSLTEHDPIESSSESLIDPEDTRFLIRQVFRLIEGEFSLLHQQVFRAYVLQELSAEEVAKIYEIALERCMASSQKFLAD